MWSAATASKTSSTRCPPPSSSNSPMPATPPPGTTTTHSPTQSSNSSVAELVVIQHSFRMMEVVPSPLPSIQMWWRDPFLFTFIVFSGGPAPVGGQPVIGSARQGELVDVGLPAAGPVRVGVVHLTPVGGHVTTRARTPALEGVQHQPLRRGGQPAVAAPVQLTLLGLVEHQQIVVGVGGHAQHIFHRQHGAAAGARHPGLGLQVL